MNSAPATHTKAQDFTHNESSGSSLVDAILQMVRPKPVKDIDFTCVADDLRTTLNESGLLEGLDDPEQIALLRVVVGCATIWARAEDEAARLAVLRKLRRSGEARVRRLRADLSTAANALTAATRTLADFGVAVPEVIQDYLRQYKVLLADNVHARISDELEQLQRDRLPSSNPAYKTEIAARISEFLIRHCSFKQAEGDARAARIVDTLMGEGPKFIAAFKRYTISDPDPTGRGRTELPKGSPAVRKARARLTRRAMESS